MDKLVSAGKMKSLEQSVFSLGVDSFSVMEKAALRIYDAVKERFSATARVIAVCGKGNNGGDGLAVTRMLKMDGYDVAVCLPYGKPSTPDAVKNYEMVEKLGIPVISQPDFERYDVVIDAIFGTGLSKNVELEIVEKINNSNTFVVSVDIPSGINSDSGAVMGMAVKADLTVALAFKKYGHSIYPGREYCGEIELVDIGIPFDGECEVFETDSLFVNQIIAPTKTDVHKGNMGKLCVIAGSKGMTGAATLCCEGALKSGCGLVSLFTPENLNDIYEKKLTEAMTIPLNCENYIDSDMILGHKDRLISSDAVVIGPGLGRECQAEKIIEFLLTNKIPTVIDADGINALAANINVLRGEKGEVVITPHMGEFSRLTGLSAEQILADRLKISRQFAREFGVTLVLKGAGTVIALPDGKAFINHTGNCGMATGGSGDVLAGITAAFLARGICAGKSAAAAVYIHGAAGDIARDKLGENSMLPTDITDNLHNAFLTIKNQDC